MDELTVLSPHYDDAAFSLCLSLARWRDRPLNLRIVNFFTISAYGPRAGFADKTLVSALRKREDTRVLRRIHHAVKLERLDLLDAPLRLGVDASAVCGPETDNLQLENDTRRLAFRIGRYFNRGLALSPLGLGNHVDHLAVKMAALSLSVGQKLGFYEDLPYAYWTPDSLLREIVSDTEQRTGVLLRPVIIRGTKSLRWKRQVISGYQTQISAEQAAQIAQFAATYSSGERIWIPKHARGWTPLIT